MPGSRGNNEKDTTKSPWQGFIRTPIMTSSKAKLLDATRQLQARWDQTRVHWQDRKAADFEEQYMVLLLQDVQTALRAIDELDKLLHQVHADCE